MLLLDRGTRRATEETEETCLEQRSNLNRKQGKIHLEYLQMAEKLGGIFQILANVRKLNNTMTMTINVLRMTMTMTITSIESFMTKTTQECPYHATQYRKKQ